MNTVGGDINSSATTVNAAGTLINAGRIEGDTVTTNSASLANTGTVIGNDVTVNAANVQNTGIAAVIAGANSVHLYAQDSVTNADGALIYSAGNLEIARDGTRDASGLLAHQTGTLTNRAATIGAEGDIDIAAHGVSNVRTGILTGAGAPQTTTTTLTAWTAGIPIGDALGSHFSLTFPQWTWKQDQASYKEEIVDDLRAPVTVTVPKAQVTNLDTTANTLTLTQGITEQFYDSTHTTMTCDANGLNCNPLPVLQTRQIGTNPVQWYTDLTDNGDTYTITLWPDFDPAKNIRPDQLIVNHSLGDDSHDYSEISRTVTTTASTDRLVDAGHAATIQAQGAIRINADGGSIRNGSSTIAAGGDLVRRAEGGSVTDSGTVLQQTLTRESASTFYWHQKTGGDSDTQTVPDGITQSRTTVDALPAIASSNQTVQTDARTITIGSVDRQGQTVAGSGVTGGSADGMQAGTINDQPDRPQTIGIANLTLPTNGLYTYSTEPEASYLVVTDPRFTQYSGFISSDYMLGQLGIDPQKTIKRLGDGVYEQMLIRNQVTQLTGRTFLDGYSDSLSEYTALMNSGVAYAQAFGLAPGIALSASQMAELTTSMVWLVSRDVTLPDGSHQTVLVPQVYLAKPDTVDLTHSGALVAGNAVSLKATDDVNSSAHVVSSVATTVVGNTIVNSGVIGSAGTTVVAAVEDVRNLSGRIGGGDVLVQAGRDVVNGTQTYGVSKAFGSETVTGSITGSITGTGIDAVGTISATGSATIFAGRDVTLTGATIQAGGDVALAAGRDLNAGTATLASTQDVQTHNGMNGSHTAITQNPGSAITAGGDLATLSGRDTTLTGATIKSGGDATMVASGNLTVTAAKDTQTQSERSMGGELSHHSSSSYDESVRGSAISAGGNMTLAAGQGGCGKLAITGSSVSANSGGVALVSTGDITLGSVSETHDSQSWSQTRHTGFLSTETTTGTSSSHQVLANGSTVSGDTVTGVAGRDMTVSGSTLAATHDVMLAAGNSLVIDATQDSSESSHFHQTIKTGLGSAGGVGASYGTVDTKDMAHDRMVSNTGSLIGSTDGSVSLTAGADLHVTGSHLIAAQNVVGTGANVTLDAATDTAHHDETHEVSRSGFTLAVRAPVLDAVSNAVDQTHAASHSQDDRAAALHGMAAASGVYDAYGAAGSALNDLTGGNRPEAKLELSYGSSHSRDQFTEDSMTDRGSGVSAGNTAAFVATGNDTAASGNITIAGSTVQAGNVILAAKNQVNLIHTTDTDSTRSTSESSSASVGVSYGTQGFGVSASMAKAHGNASSDAAMQNSTQVTATNTATIVSGGDTKIIGATVSARQVSADVGGNLNLASVQDTMSGAAHQESTGGGFAISQGGGSASFSHTNANATGSYAGVNEQSGIRAGDGGFNISVHGATDLLGAVITGDADPLKNHLSTGTLSFSDIQNRSSYDAHSGGFSAGASTGDGGANYSTHGNTSGRNTGGGSPMPSQDDNGSDGAITRSGISAGTISVTDPAIQLQDIASLNRDTSDTNGTIARLPDLNRLLDQQADRMSASGAAGEAVSRRIGDYADEQARATGNPEWDEGGTNRTALHIAGGALIGGLGGGAFGTALQGAAGAGVSAAFAGKLNGLADLIGDATGSMTLGNMVSNVLAGVGGALVGGSAGAFTASNADLYNRSTGNGDGKGGTGSDFLDRLGDAIRSTADDPLGALNHALNSVIPAPSAQKPDADANPLVDANDNKTPPATGGAVVTPPAMVCTPNAGCVMTPAVATPGMPGYVPNTATLNSGDNGVAKSGNEATQPITADNFFDGTTYTSKVRNQAASGDYHGFPQSADAFSGEGNVQPITGGDGVTRWKLTIPGSYNGTAGIFEYIRNPDGTINHRLFVPTK
nr:hemagglutinin repeat-containing protein [Paraburkholderia sp. BCC1886]